MHWTKVEAATGEQMLQVSQGNLNKSVGNYDGAELSTSDRPIKMGFPLYDVQLRKTQGKIFYK
jgi:hypothetical protein